MPDNTDQQLSYDPNAFDTANAVNVADEGVQHVNDIGEQQKAAAIPGGFHEVKYSRNAQGGIDVQTKMDDSVFQAIARWTQMGQQADQLYRGAISQIQAKQKFLQENPAIAGIGAIASRAALGYSGGALGSRVLPITHAMGAYGADFFGKSPDQLGVEAAQLQAENVRTQSPIIAGLEAQDRLQQTRAAFEQREEDRRQSRYDRAVAPMRHMVSQGYGSDETIRSFVDKQVANGALTEDQAAQELQGLITTRNTATAAKAEFAADKKQEWDREQKIRQDYERANMRLQHELKQLDLKAADKRSESERRVVGLSTRIDSLTKQYVKIDEDKAQASATLSEIAAKVGMGVLPEGGFTKKGADIVLRAFNNFKPSIDNPAFRESYGDNIEKGVVAYQADKRKVDVAYSKIATADQTKVLLQREIDAAKAGMPEVYQKIYNGEQPTTTPAPGEKKPAAAAASRTTIAGETATRKQNPQTKKWFVYKNGEWQPE